MKMFQKNANKLTYEKMCLHSTENENKKWESANTSFSLEKFKLNPLLRSHVD